MTRSEMEEKIIDAKRAASDRAIFIAGMKAALDVAISNYTAIPCVSIDVALRKAIEELE